MLADFYHGLKIIFITLFENTQLNVNIKIPCTDGSMLCIYYLLCIYEETLYKIFI